MIQENITLPVTPVVLTKSFFDFVRTLTTGVHKVSRAKQCQRDCLPLKEGKKTSVCFVAAGLSGSPPCQALRAAAGMTPEIKAWVVFHSQTDLPWLKIFKPGFRHCYVLLNDGNHWVSVDPLSNYMDINVHQLPAHFDLPLWLRDRGHTVVAAPVTRLKKEAPWMFFTCVEAVKRVLGIHKRFIFTPWQLYRHLQTQTYTQGDNLWAV